MLGAPTLTVAVRKGGETVETTGWSGGRQRTRNRALWREVVPGHGLCAPEDDLPPYSEPGPGCHRGCWASAGLTVQTWPGRQETALPTSPPRKAHARHLHFVHSFVHGCVTVQKQTMACPR